MIFCKHQRTKTGIYCPASYFYLSSDSYYTDFSFLLQKIIPWVCLLRGETEVFFFSKKNIYLFIWPCGVLVEAWGTQVPEHGLYPATCIGSMGSQPLDHQEVPEFLLLDSFMIQQECIGSKEWDKTGKTFKSCGWDRQSYLDCV